MKSPQALLRDFSQQLSKVPGVLHIDNYDDNLIVFFDSDQLKDKLPGHFANRRIVPFDVKCIWRESQQMLQHMRNQQVDLNNSNNAMAVKIFTRAIEMCEKLMTKEQSK